MAHHLTPAELADQMQMEREEVIGKCVQMGVPIYHGRIDRTLFETSLRSIALARPRQGSRRSLSAELDSRGRCRGEVRTRRRSPTCCRRRRSNTAPKSPSATRRATPGSRKTFDEVREIVRPLAFGLVTLGVEKGDRVSILGNTRPEWTYFDFAALSIGATVVPIYQTNSPEECRYVLENSDSKVVVVEDAEQLEKVRQVRDQLPQLEHDRADDRQRRRRDLDGGPGRQRRRRRCGHLGGALRRGHPRRHLHLHLHLGHHRPAEGLRHQPRQLPGDAGHGQRRQRHRRRGPRLPLPAARPLLRAADPVRHLRPRHHPRLLGARPAEDPAEPGRTETDLLPLGAADLREDLHRRDQRDRERGRRSKRRSSTGRSGSARRCARPNAAAASPASCCSASTTSPTSRCSRKSAASSAAGSASPSPAPRRSTRRSCASSTPPASSCSRAGG